MREGITPRQFSRQKEAKGEIYKGGDAKKKVTEKTLATLRRRNPSFKG